MGRRSRYVAWVAGLVVAVAVAGVLWLGRWSLDTSPSGPTRMLAVQPAGCDPTAGYCTARSNDLTVHVRLGPPVVVLKSFPVTVHLHPSSTFAVRQVLVQFTMKGMDMGLNRYRLVPDGAGGWTGSAMLPVCTTGRTDWLATVVLDGPAGGRRARFAFSAALH